MCELNRLQTAEDTETYNSEEYLRHIKEKEATRIIRNRDRESKAWKMF